MANSGKFTSWGTSTGKVAFRVEHDKGQVGWEMEADKAEEFAHHILEDVAWVRQHVLHPTSEGEQ